MWAALISLSQALRKVSKRLTSEREIVLLVLTVLRLLACGAGAGWSHDGMPENHPRRGAR
ncbi:hypothetical protein D7S89_20065 [Trinickia fusca]|uniref:Uncharacterized protein n=1 Tax=Trinickia fusca TaxID=2419777 RepID=A0A494X7P1_9BURK|nr:hypothetical protein D7S89_20065 [Trinickia fusca]